MIVNTHLYSHRSYAPENIDAGWTLWFVEARGSMYWYNTQAIRFPVKPTKKQIRKLRRKFINDCKSC